VDEPTVKRNAAMKVNVIVDVYRRKTDTCLTIEFEGLPAEFVDEWKWILVDEVLKGCPGFELVYVGV
jgi:hypothetical protein